MSKVPDLDQLPSLVKEASKPLFTYVVNKGENSLETVVLIRILRIIGLILHTHELGVAASAASDPEVLLALLKTPEILTVLMQNDPLAKAKIKGIEVIINLREAQGGCVSASEAEKLANVSRQAIDKARKSNRILAFPAGQKKWVYPVWQFHNGGYLKDLGSILEILIDYSAYEIAAFILNKNSRLSNKTPLELMRAGKTESVLKAAKAFGIHGAV